MTTSLNISYGIVDFQALIKESCFYQDRANRIPIIESAGKQ